LSIFILDPLCPQNAENLLTGCRSLLEWYECFFRYVNAQYLGRPRFLTLTSVVNSFDISEYPRPFFLYFWLGWGGMFCSPWYTEIGCATVMSPILRAFFITPSSSTTLTPPTMPLNSTRSPCRCTSPNVYCCKYAPPKEATEIGFACWPAEGIAQGTDNRNNPPRAHQDHTCTSKGGQEACWPHDHTCKGRDSPPAATGEWLCERKFSACGQAALTMKQTHFFSFFIYRQLHGCTTSSLSMHFLRMRPAATKTGMGGTLECFGLCPGKETTARWLLLSLCRVLALRMPLGGKGT